MSNDRENREKSRTGWRPANAPHSGAQPPVRRDADAPPAPADRSTQSEIADFLDKMRTLAPQTGVPGRGRLVFAMDATMSRQPTWDMALALQGEMFEAVREIGGLDVQLVFFRGFGECRASKWVSDPAALQRLMTSVSCQGGRTQIEKVLGHVRQESEARRVNALVYVGDCMEENVDLLCDKAGALGLLGVPAFMFQEGREPVAESAYREIARLTRGAYCRFDARSAAQLKELLAAVAVYAAGGEAALKRLGSSGGRGARLLIEQMKPGGGSGRSG